MGDMPGSTFHASRTERLRRRSDGPALTLVRGTGGGSRTPTRDVRPAHPARPGFMPDGIPGDARGTAVQDSESGSPPVEHLSRGNATLDIDGRASTGSGPIDLRNPDLVRLVQFLQALTGDAEGGRILNRRTSPL
jgi:hypothetical protein